MKVILLRDVAKIGKKFEVVSVPDGYALNKLIPQKDAEPATPANLKRVQEKAKITAAGKEGDIATIKHIVEVCAKTPLMIVMDANEQGHLFKGVNASDVIEAAKKQDLVIPPQFIKIEETIKAVGNFAIALVAADYKASINIEVKAK